MDSTVADVTLDAQVNEELTSGYKATSWFTTTSAVSGIDPGKKIGIGLLPAV